MDFNLSEEQRLLQDSARRMADAEITPRLRAQPSDAPLPKSVMLQIYAVLAREGLTAPRLSHEDGGAAMTMLDYGIVFEQLPPVIGISLISHECTIARINAESRSAAARELLPDLIAGRRICCTGSTEPDTGSDPRGIATRAADDGDHLVVNGRKMWITNGSISDVMIATCLTGRDSRGVGVMRRVLIDRAVSPYEAREIPVLGFRQGHLSEVLIENCRVPKENALGEGGDAARILQTTWVGNRPLLGLSAVHLAQRALELAIEYSKVRVQFGGPIGQKQLVQEKLVEIATAVTTSRLLCYYALSLIDSGGRADGTAAMAKRYAMDACGQAISLAMHVHGAMGIAQESGLEEMYRDVRMLPIPDGTNDILALILGRELTGLDAIRSASRPAPSSTAGDASAS